LSHQSSARSSNRSYRDEFGKKIKHKSSKVIKNHKSSHQYNEPSSQERRRGESSINSNSKTKSTNDSSNNQANTFNSLSSQPGSWNTSNDFAKSSNTRNMMGSNAYSVPHGAQGKAGKEYNFTSSDLKSQYLTHGVSKRNEDTPGKTSSKKPPMHKKGVRESGEKSNRLSKREKTKHPSMSSSVAIEQILQGIKPNIDPLDLKLPNEESTKFSTKKNGIIAGYAANTNQGIIRTYNEDRVSIILNIVKPKGKENIENWPKWSFFAIYDGHGGNVWADFLKDNLHQFIVRQEWFPDDVKTAIKRGWRDAENLFFELSEAQAKKTGELDKSGSWAIAVLIVENIAYIANVGDSRAILSKHKGKEIVPLSEDHRPERKIEHERITKNGGHIYQTQSSAKVSDNKGGVKIETIVGPLRVFPGRLSVSRTFGDIEAKMAKYGGNIKVVIAEPEIDVFEIDETCDFFLLGCDGIYDKLSSEESVKWVWETYEQHRMPSLHSQIGKGVELTLK
jgi:serine/threonine protein phosphatase PrpC